MRDYQLGVTVSPVLQRNATKEDREAHIVPTGCCGSGVILSLSKDLVIAVPFWRSRSISLRRWSVRVFPMKFLRKGGFPLFGLPALFCIEGAGFPSFILSGAEGLAVLVDLGGHCRDGFREAAALEFAFPDNDDGPAFSLQLAPGVLVALLVPCYLGGPEVGVGFGDGVVLTVFVAVPEAAVDEDDGAVFGEDDVRFAGEVSVVDAVTEAQAPEGFAEEQLRLGGGGVDGGHVCVALGRGEGVGHYSGFSLCNITDFCRILPGDVNVLGEIS